MNLLNLKLLLVGVLLFPLSIMCQRLNRYNKQGERKGRWVVYLDSAKTIKSMEGRFRNGNSVGKAFYYTMDGKLERKEISRFKKLKTTFYYPNGTVHLKGKARLDDNPEKIHYYFYGKWKHYDSTGRLVKYRYYEKGKLVKTEYPDKNNLTNDSLVGVLLLFEKRFQQNNQDLIDKINGSGLAPVRVEKYREDLMRRDSGLFADLDKFLVRFGYPSKKVVGEATDIPFYIISFATADVKAKYIDLFWEAVRRGDLQAKPLAFYIDKMKVAKGEKQVYGTQTYLDMKKMMSFEYPSIDPENLAKRRAEVGLEE